MKIKYELNNAYVCHDNVRFKIPSILVKNMTDKVILGLPFINALYSFLVEHDGITFCPIYIYMYVCTYVCMCVCVCVYYNKYKSLP